MSGTHASDWPGRRSQALMPQNLTRPDCIVDVPVIAAGVVFRYPFRKEKTIDRTHLSHNHLIFNVEENRA